MVSDPALTPVTKPEALTVAMLVKAELHEPPVSVSLKVMEELAQTLNEPVMAPALGVGDMVTTSQAKSVPHVFVTV